MIEKKRGPRIHFAQLGWYWLKPDDGGPIMLIEVYREEGQLYARQKGQIEPTPVRELVGEWIGPIQV